MVKLQSTYSWFNVKDKVEKECKPMYQPGIFIKAVGLIIVVIVWMIEKLFSLIPLRKDVNE